MRAEHIKGLLAETRNKEMGEAPEEQTLVAEGMMAVTDGTGGEERRGKMPEEVSNCERVVYLIQAVFGEGRLAE